MRLILSEKDKHIIVTVLGDYATEIDRQATKSKEDLDTLHIYIIKGGGPSRLFSPITSVFTK